MKKSFEEINEKITNGNVVVLTAEEVSKMAEELSPEEISRKVDIVTTATFGPMCSSGAFINFGHADPPIRMEKILLNNVPCSGGLAAVDTFIGATEEAEDSNDYGGAHLICDLIDGKDVHLQAWGKGTDCYPRKQVDTYFNKTECNEMILFNPRNAYQNYPAAANLSGQSIYTYMGVLLANSANVNYSTSGELSPLLNDPELRTIGIGSRIFLGGTQGFVAWNGTQFHTSREQNEKGIPLQNAATLSVIGNMKEMSTEYIKPAVFEKYGMSLFVGIGVPIPILDADIANRVSIRNREIDTNICDYSKPDHPAICKTNYEELFSGWVNVNGRKTRTAPMSSLSKARQIAEKLKNQIQIKNFFLNEPVQLFPTGTSLNSLEIRKGKNGK